MQRVDLPPNHEWYCKLSTTSMWTASLCSILFITNMTFERFYSIIRPHKAASFNTVKRAKTTITCIIIFSIIYNIPHIFVTLPEGRACVPFGNAVQTDIGLFYYWFSLVVHFALPFVLLLIMNCVIIHTIHTRSNLVITRSAEGQGQTDGQASSRIKHSEMQIYIILLLVTFGFLILMTPSYVHFVWTMFTNYEKSAKLFAQFYILHSTTQKSHYTNYGINFFLYVISGQKFRTDLINLFKRKHQNKNKNKSKSDSIT